MILDLGDDIISCESSVTLSANDGFQNYVWQNGEMTSVININESGDYWVVATDICGNQQRDTISINLLDNQETTEFLNICPQDSALIFGNYETETGVYASVFPAFNGCDSIHNISLEVIEPMMVSFEIIGTCQSQNNGQVTAVVVGGNLPYQYVWDGGISNEPLYGNLAAGEYELIIADNFGCTILETIMVPEFEDSAVGLIASPVSCHGEQDGVLEILPTSETLQFSLDGSNFTTQMEFINLPPDDYTLFTKSGNDCMTQLPFTITEPEELLVQLPADLTICSGESVNLMPSINSTDTLFYQWLPESDISCGNCLNATVSPFQSTKYSLSISNLNDCIAVDEILVTVIERRAFLLQMFLVLIMTVLMIDFIFSQTNQ